MKGRAYGLIFLLVIVCIGLLIAYFQEERLKNNYITTAGAILNLETTVQNPEVFVRFSFLAGKFDKNGVSSIFNSHKMYDFKFLDSLLKNKSLPVIYQKGNPGNNKMLFSKNDCKIYRVQLSASEEKLINTIDSLTKSKK